MKNIAICICLAYPNNSCWECFNYLMAAWVRNSKTRSHEKTMC